MSRPWLFRSLKMLADLQHVFDYSYKAFTIQVVLSTMFCIRLYTNMRFNYCNLSVGSPEEMSKWMYQARELLRLACAALQKESYADQKGTKTNHLAQADSNLARLAIQVMVSLTDSSTWKCLGGPEQVVRKRKADLVVLSLLEWLASESAGFFLAVRSYILENFLVPGIKNQEVSPCGKEDKLIITALLRPLLVLSAECRKDGKGAENSKNYKDYTFAAERAAALFSVHILTIPFLTQRLPQPLLPALQDPLVLSPCLRFFEVPIRDPPQIVTATSVLPCLPSFQGRVDCELVDVPLSAWALSNVVCLASHTLKHNPRFMKSSPCQKYVQALCCLLEDLNMWIETIRKRREAEKSVSEEEGDKDVENTKNVVIGDVISKSCEGIIIQLLVESLSPLHQQWHLVELVEKATFNQSTPMVFISVAKGSIKGAKEKLFTLSDVAKIYSILLQVFAVLNPFGGALPIVNLIAFTPSIVPLLWSWLHASPGLAHLLKLNLQEQGNAKHQLETQAIQAEKAILIRTGVGVWAAVLGLRNKLTRHDAALERRAVNERTETSRSADVGSYRSGTRIDPELARRWAAEIRDMRTISNSPSRASGSNESLGMSKSIRDMKTEGNVAPQITDMDNVKSGSECVPEEVLPVLLLFCEAYSHFLFVLDDEDFYERQEPFTLAQQKVISGMLNTLVYHELLSTCKRSNFLLMDVAIKCVKPLYERDCRRSFCPPYLWIAPAVATQLPSRAAAGASEGNGCKSSQMAALGAILRTIPHVLSFEERVHIFREFVRTDKLLKGMEGGTVSPVPGTISIVVKRDNLFEDGLAQLNPLGPRLKSCINVSFENESVLAAADLDHGGSLKELLTDLANTAFDPEYGLFVQTATDGLLLPRAAAGNLDSELRKLKFLGQIVGKALYEGILLEHSLSPLFISKVLGRCSFLDDLSSEDSELHRKLVYLKKASEDAQDLKLNFTVKEDLFDEHWIVELQPGGADIPVTNENKLQYVNSVVNHKLNRQMKPVTAAFVRGMADLIDPEWLGLFNAKEFNRLVSGGDHDFDVDDLRIHTCYANGYSKSSLTIKIFWEVVREFEEEERSALLKFVTGCSRPPLFGFEYLQPAFTIERVVSETSAWAKIFGQDVNCLPTASTCNNTLKLPMYKRASFLKEKLQCAMKSSTRLKHP
nr:E3 ubiquitin-protein ligase UPL7-like isoform X3 [Physcomitrium patens]XP_024374886.1 E3 ubiquitin-protein ligase UPL7-like isoform X3 [Physcomitrium patens]|eukprot:XP_024374884.1 E3 ubiquitin-protein ligase UPL7-like isoform X3 [Physcomitrella patens]